MKPSFSPIMAYIFIISSKPNTIYHGCLLVFCIVFMTVTNAYCTSIITIRTNNEIIIGADSFEGNEFNEHLGSTCKIIQGRDVFFATAGITRSEDPKFDFTKITTEILSRELSIEERLAIYDKTIRIKLGEIVNHIKQDKVRFNSIRHKTRVGLTVAMNTANTLTVYYIEHKVINTADEPANIQTITNGLNRKLATGEDAEIDIIWNSTDKEICTQIIANANIVDIITPIRTCIELIAQKRLDVKLPVDILRITRNGATWIQHKPECPEIQNNYKH